MKADQKYTPKWWVGRDKSEGTFVTTMYKSSSQVYFEMEITYGEDWYVNEDLEVVLVEIKMVNL